MRRHWTLIVALAVTVPVAAIALAARSSPHSVVTLTPGRIEFSPANYGPELGTPSELSELDTRAWLGGEGLYNQVERTMAQSGDIHVVSVPVGRDLITGGYPHYVVVANPASDYTTCQTQACSLPQHRFTAEARAVVAQHGHGGLYWNIGNEPNVQAPSGSAGVLPSVWVGQFEAWYQAIKTADPRAHILAASVASWAHTPGRYYGYGRDWMNSAMADYRAAYGRAIAVDIFTIHDYGNGSSEFDAMRADLRAWGISDRTPIWCTEGSAADPQSGEAVTSYSVIRAYLDQISARAAADNVPRYFYFSAPNVGLNVPIYDYSHSHPWPLTVVGKAIRDENMATVAASRSGGVAASRSGGVAVNSKGSVRPAR